MSTSAIIVMIISIVLVWGGMVAAILHIRRFPDTQAQESDDPALADAVRDATPPEGPATGRSS